MKSVLSKILVNKQSVLSKTGGISRCSYACRQEDGDDKFKGYKFVDSCRFQRSFCLHAT